MGKDEVPISGGFTHSPSPVGTEAEIPGLVQE